MKKSLINYFIVYRGGKALATAKPKGYQENVLYFDDRATIFSSREKARKAIKDTITWAKKENLMILPAWNQQHVIKRISNII